MMREVIWKLKFCRQNPKSCSFIPKAKRRKRFFLSRQAMYHWDSRSQIGGFFRHKKAIFVHLVILFLIIGIVLFEPFLHTEIASILLGKAFPHCRKLFKTFFTIGIETNEFFHSVIGHSALVRMLFLPVGNIQVAMLSPVSQQNAVFGAVDSWSWTGRSQKGKFAGTIITK